MPIDNDYFKNRQQNNNGGNNNNNGNFQPPFETPEFFKNFGKKAGAIYVVIIAIVALFIFKPFELVSLNHCALLLTYKL